MTQTNTQQKYTNAKEAFEDLKEKFLTIIVNKPDLGEGYTQALAIQALKNMDDTELLQFANKEEDVVKKMRSAANIQREINRQYAAKEPENSWSINEFMARQPTLLHNKHVLMDCMTHIDRIQYNRAFQMMHEHIESQFKRPMVNADQIQRREDMMDGLVLANPFELIKVLDNAESATDKKKYLDSVAESLIYVTKETRGEHTENKALEHGIEAKAAGFATVGLGIATIAVASKVEKDNTPARVAEAGLGFSTLVVGLIAFSQLMKQSRKFAEALNQYAQVTQKVMSNDTLRHNFYALKVPRERYDTKHWIQQQKKLKEAHERT